MYSKEDKFILMEEMHDKWSQIYSNFILENIDSLVFAAINNPEILISLEEDLAKSAESFSNAYESLKYYWENEYILPTILDNSVKNLISDKSNVGLKTELAFTINKAKCILALLNKADQILEEITKANNEDNVSSKNTSLEVAHNYYSEFQELNYYLSNGFKDKTFIDTMVYPIINNKKAELELAIDSAKQLEIELLGVIEDELV
ncbi:MAG: hypothetical protein ACK4OM_05135 [Alphaproteobacteria bacterium]